MRRTRATPSPPVRENGDFGWELHPDNLYDVLSEARSLGLIGEQPITRQILHAGGFALVCDALLEPLRPMPARTENPVLLLDLGSGGGLPGLVLACSPPAAITGVVLLEGSRRRADWLRKAVVTLHLAGHTEVLSERAETAGRTAARRGRYSVVVARAFGRAGVTAECAAPLLHVGGVLVVAEPPGTAGGDLESSDNVVVSAIPSDHARWPRDALAELGLGEAVGWIANGFRYAAMRVTRPCPERYPRRTGIPAKRPLF